MKTHRWQLVLAVVIMLVGYRQVCAQALVGGIPNGEYEPLHAWYDVNQSLDIWEGRTDQYDDEYLVDVRDTATGSGDARGDSYWTNVETWAQFDDHGGDFWPERVGGFTGIQNGMVTWQVRNAAGWDDRGGWSDEDGVGTDGIGWDGSFTIFMAMNIYEVTNYTGVWDVSPTGPNDDTPILNGSTAVFNQGANDIEQPGKALLWLDAERDGENGPVWVMDSGFEMVAGPVTLDQWQVHTFVYNGENSEHYIDGELVASGDAGENRMQNLAFWSTDGGWFRAGSLDFAEGLFYDGMIASSDRAGIEQYLLTKWGIGSSVPWDFDGNGELGLGDMNLLLRQVDLATNDLSFDITGDGLVGQADIESLISDPDKLNSYIGDANLDGEFNSDDFVTVFIAGQYEDDVADNSTWDTGDWDGDREFTSSDFVAAFIQGGYEIGKRNAVSSVPEPGSLTLLTLALLSLGIACRRR